MQATTVHLEPIRRGTTWGAVLVAASFATLGPVFGVAGAAPPELTILEAPPACCAGTWAGEFRGSVSGADASTTAVVLYARTDLYYVQPYAASTLDIDALGRWGSMVRGGTSYAALLVRGGYQPPATMSTLPEPGGDVLAVRRAPDDQRRIDFAGFPWLVRASGASVFGPGPNLWSDDPQAVWTDAGGDLHMTLAPRQGIWYAAEVYGEWPLGFGRYRFEVDGPLDRLDPNVVFSGFLYADSGAELDVEWARWGDAAKPDNAQFSAPPDRLQRFTHPSMVGPVTAEILWMPDQVGFTLRAGALGQPGATLATWSMAEAIPDPSGARIRFNLWLAGGAPPSDGLPVEIVVRDFAFAQPTDVADAAPRGWRLDAPTFASGGRLDYRIETARPVDLVVRLVDVRGRRIATLFTGQVPAGSHALGWQPEPGVTLARGVYFLAAHVGSRDAVRKLVWQR